MSDSKDRVSFNDVIDEETIERTVREHGDETEEHELFLPFLGQTYKQLVYALLGGIPVYIATYVAVAYLFGVHDSVFAGTTVDAVHDRRHVAAAAAFICGIYYITATVKAYGIPLLNYWIGLLVAILVPYGVHHGPWTPDVTTAEIGLFITTNDFSFHPSLIISIIYITAAYTIPFVIVTKTVDILIKHNDDLLQRVLSWEDEHMPFSRYAEYDIAKKLTEKDQSNQQ